MIMAPDRSTVDNGFNLGIVFYNSEDSVIIEAALTEEAMNPYGIAHGGFIFGLGDVAMGVLAIKKGKRE